MEVRLRWHIFHSTDDASIIVVDEVQVVSVGRLRFAEFGDALGTWVVVGCGLLWFVTKCEVLPPFSDAINVRISASVLAKDFASISFCRSNPASSGLSRNGP